MIQHLDSLICLQHHFWFSVHYKGDSFSVSFLSLQKLDLSVTSYLHIIFCNIGCPIAHYMMGWWMGGPDEGAETKTGATINK